MRRRRLLSPWPPTPLLPPRPFRKRTRSPGRAPSRLYSLPRRPPSEGSTSAACPCLPCPRRSWPSARREQQRRRWRHEERAATKALCRRLSTSTAPRSPPLSSLPSRPLAPSTAWFSRRRAVGAALGRPASEEEEEEEEEKKGNNLNSSSLRTLLLSTSGASAAPRPPRPCSPRPPAERGPCCIPAARRAG